MNGQAHKRTTPAPPGLRRNPCGGGASHRGGGGASRGLALALAFTLCAATGMRAGGAQYEGVPERYRPILNRAPFGPPPPSGPTPEELARQQQEAAEAAQNQQEPWIIPPGLDKIKITLISRYQGVPAVGFSDGSDGASYYLMEGQQFNGITCGEIDLKGGTVMLRRGGLEAQLPLWINPATTNRGDVTTFGQPGGRPVDLSTLQQKTDWEVEAEKSEARRKLEAERERRRKEREEAEERRRKEREELMKLTPEQRERRMHDVNLDIIMNGKGPPLPIELDDEDIRKLREAGFEIPPQATEGAGGDAAGADERENPVSRRRRRFRDAQTRRHEP